MFNIQFNTGGQVSTEPVRCTKCGLFLIRVQDDGAYDLFCPASGQCDFREPEEAKPGDQRPFWRPQAGGVEWGI